LTKIVKCCIANISTAKYVVHKSVINRGYLLQEVKTESLQERERSQRLTEIDESCTKNILAAIRLIMKKILSLLRKVQSQILQ
jgi:hypothetical protein